MLRSRLLSLLLLVLLAGCAPALGLKPASTIELPPTAEIDARRQPTPTRKRTPNARATATPLPEGDDAEAVDQAAREGLERDPILLAAAFRGLQLPAPTPAPRASSVGDAEEFWVLNIEQSEYYSTQATLEVQTEHLNFYVSNQVLSDRAALERSARRFEEETVPALLSIFEEQVDVPQITVLIANIPGAAGYYSAEDLLPRAANPYSNERPMIYMSPGVPPGTPSFDSTLAHETQHLLHRRILTSPALWFNEGASMLIEHLLNYDPNSFGSYFVQDPDLQLNTWGETPGSSYGHYAQSQLFLAYLYDRLGDKLPLAKLTREDAGHNLTQFAALTGDEDVGDLVADWAVANLLDDPSLDDGRYAYEALPQTVEPQEVADEELEGEVAQLGADYLLFAPAREERVVQFEGDQLVPLTAAALEDEQAWWSGRGDNRVSTLSTTLDLREVEGATLRFQLWYHLEQDYDYAFVAASTDGGQTWKTLPGRHTTSENPQGLSYGDAYTGTSDGWLEEEVDLGSLAGQEALLGFWVVNDQGFNTPGLLVKDVEVAELGGALESWQADGFVQVHNRLPQSWELRLVELGDRPVVHKVTVEAGRAEVTLPAGARTVLVVLGTTPETTERGRYRLTIDE